MRTFLRDLATPLMVAALVAVVGYDHFVTLRQPAPSALDGAKLGRDYAATLGPALAEGWVAAADAIDAGKPVADAQAALQSAFKDARTRTFAAKVAPGFARVLPEGTEPASASARAEVSALWRDFARGLKGGK